MSSATSALTTAAVMERRNYLCNSCNGDVSHTASATASATGLTCPHSNSWIPSDYIPNPNANHLIQNSSELSLPSFVDPSTPITTTDSTRTFPFSSVTASDDNFRLDSPYLHRLIQHLTHSNDSSPSTATTTSTVMSHHHSPTSKSAIEAIPMIKITSAFLDIDPIVLCAVCKDQFLIDDEAKQLPCKHMYHPDCILPWLSQRNSCPVCRYQLPKESISGDVKTRRRSRSRVLRLGDLTEDVDDEAMLGIGFSNLHHQYLLPEINPEVIFPFTHIGQTVEVDVLPDSDQANGLENVLGWPNWHVYGGDNGVNVGWVNNGDVALP